jgi:hypothetical protein
MGVNSAMPFTWPQSLQVRTAGLSGDADQPLYPWRHPEHHRGPGLPRTTSIGSAVDKANTAYLAHNAANRDNAGKAANTPKSSKLTELSGPPELANGESRWRSSSDLRCPVTLSQPSVSAALLHLHESEVHATGARREEGEPSTNGTAKTPTPDAHVC